MQSISERLDDLCSGGRWERLPDELLDPCVKSRLEIDPHIDSVVTSRRVQDASVRLQPRDCCVVERGAGGDKWSHRRVGRPGPSVELGGKEVVEEHLVSQPGLRNSFPGCEPLKHVVVDQEAAAANEHGGVANVLFDERQDALLSSVSRQTHLDGAQDGRLRRRVFLLSLLLDRHLWLDRRPGGLVAGARRMMRSGRDGGSACAYVPICLRCTQGYTAVEHPATARCRCPTVFLKNEEHIDGDNRSNASFRESGQ